MTTEELEWFEENWNRGKTGRKAISHSREWKLHPLEPWGDHWDSYYYWDCNCWKSQRKTQYRIPKPKKHKKRKPREKEHWRFKKNHHTYEYHHHLYREAWLKRKQWFDDLRNS